MSISSTYRYVAEVTSASGAYLGELALDPDWNPALHWTHFEAVRADAVAPVMQPPQAKIKPRWDPGRHAPYVDGFEVTFAGDTGDSDRRFRSVVPSVYFHESAQKALAALVETGKLRDGETFTYRICAYPRPDVNPSTPDEDEDFCVEAIPAPLRLDERTLDPLVNRAARCGENAWKENDIPVFIPQKVLEEATEMAHRADNIETGGVLVGRLHRDPGNRALFIQVTAQIPAEHTHAGHSSLTFTADTWAAVEAAITLRGCGEQILGWQHSHPWFCRDCPPERQQRCLFSRPMFSQDDCTVHGTVFPQAFHIALLLSFLGNDQPSYDLFGWRQGMIKNRGFYHLPGTPASNSES